MGKSARLLGQEYGLTAEEMNWLLKEEGFLDGEPGAYYVTEKGAPYASESDFHRGVGGYSFYNRYWTQRTWDESIKEVLDVSPEMISASRQAIMIARQQRREAISAEQALSEKTSEPFDISRVPADGNGMSALIKTGIIAGGTLIVAGISYGFYKASPYIKKWWNKKIRPLYKKRTKDEGLIEKVEKNEGSKGKEDDDESTREESDEIRD